MLPGPWNGGKEVSQAGAILTNELLEFAPNRITGYPMVDVSGCKWMQLEHFLLKPLHLAFLDILVTIPSQRH